MEKEFPRLEQERISVLQYASKFMELICFALGNVANETLKMNWFDSGLNHKLEVAMTISIYSSHQEMYDTIINVEWPHNERGLSLTSKGIRRKGNGRITGANNGVMPKRAPKIAKCVVTAKE